MTSPLPPNNESTHAFPVQNLDAVSPDDELLVAYLDGELDDTDRANIELKLAANEALRHRLQQLRSAWDLLDELPVTRPDPNLAQSTIEMVAMSVAQLEGGTGLRSRAGRLRWAAWLAMPLLMLAGYALVRGWYRYQERLAIAEVHLLADWEPLKTVGSYEWLEKLTSVKDLQRVSKRTSSSELGVGVVPASIDDRRAWIAQLGPTDRDRLSANLEDFKQFKRTHPAAELNNIIELGRRIYASDKTEELLQVARSYAIFLSDLSVTDRAMHLDIADLNVRVKELQRRVNRKLVEVHSHEIATDSADKQAVAEWKKEMEKKVEAYGSTFDDMFEDSMQARLQFSDELDKLTQSLTPETQEILGRLEDKSVQHLMLIYYFIKPKPQRRPLDRTLAIDEFERKPPEEQARLEFLPPEQAKDRLGVSR